MNLILIPLLIALLVAPSEQTWDHENPGSQFKSAYQTVNEYLVDKIESGETMPVNMDALSARLKAGEKDGRVAVVLRKLIALKDIRDMCNDRSYVILRDNDEATDFKSHDVTSRSSAPRRIEKLINFYATEHAKKCQPIQLAAFEKAISALDKQVFERVSTYLDPIIESLLAAPTVESRKRASDDTTNVLVERIIGKTYFDQTIILSTSNAYNTIKKLVTGVPSEEKWLHYYSDERIGRRGFFPDEFSKLIVKYLEQPCSIYVSQLGQIFENASFDALFYNQIDSSNADYYRALTYEKLCRVIEKTKFSLGFKQEVNNYALSIARREEEEAED